MIVIPFVILFTLLALFKSSFIRKHNVKLYIAATILSLAAFILRYKVPITEPFNQGFLGFSLLYIVMVTGALNKKTKLFKRLMSVRREYSIIGFIFLTPHASKYLVEFFQNTRQLEWLGVIPYIIMIPLFITSFLVIRRKFTYSVWKNIQKFAYIVYILIFVHLILVANMPNLILYIVLFVPYIIVKLYKEVI